LMAAGIKGSWRKVSGKTRNLQQPSPGGKTKHATPPAQWRQPQPPPLTARLRYGGRGHRRGSGW
jgi:hypothetical protein